MNFCNELNNVLTFFPDAIRSCCILGNLGPIYLKDYDNNIKNFDFHLLKEKKRAFYNDLINGNFSNLPCSNCMYIKEKTKNDNFSEQFELIYLNNWTQCNCGCYYCDRIPYSKGKITTRKVKSEYYDIIPIIKGLYKHNLLNKDKLRVVFHGGDLSVLKEFEPLVKLFLKEGVNKIDFSSNNIIFQPIISKCIKNKIASLNMALDAGTRDTYKKIKKVDKFNDVIKNLRKYVKESKQDNPEINVKYIILKGMNDNETEITKFIETMIDIGIKRVSLHIEHKYAIDIYQERIPLPYHYKELINLFFELCNKNGLYFDKPDDIMNYIMTK